MDEAIIQICGKQRDEFDRETNDRAHYIRSALAFTKVVNKTTFFKSVTFFFQRKLGL